VCRICAQWGTAQTSRRATKLLEPENIAKSSRICRNYALSAIESESIAMENEPSGKGWG